MNIFARYGNGLGAGLTRRRDANKQGGGNATAGHDTAGGKAKAKKEFPESPDPGMGMQDERGGKGG